MPFTGPDLCALSAVEAVSLLRSGKVSPQELLDAARLRVEAVEPLVNAMPTQCWDRAARASGNLNTESRDHPGWLAGLPIAIKDLTPVAGVRTTWGTMAYADHIPETSDPMVTRLESRGGIVVGKTNTPEYGAGGNTFNDVFGPTLNPWDTRLNAGGSSGGAAVSLATGEVWLSQGSDHGGSLRTPAAYNGIVGLRPSPGRVSSGSEIAYFIEGVQGPMARSVQDAALFLDALAGFDPVSPISYPAPDEPFQQSVLCASQKVRIGFSADLGGFAPVEPAISDALRAALSKVEANGGIVEETSPDLPHLERTYHTLRGRMWVAVFRSKPEMLTRHFKQTLKDNWEFGQTLTIDDVADAHLHRTVIYRNMVCFLQDFDVLACPVVGNMPRAQSEEWVHEVNGQPLTGYMDWLRFAFLATVTGLPAISVPVGLSNGIPVAIQLIGPPRGEARLLAVARAVEIATGGPFGPIDPHVGTG